MNQVQGNMEQINNTIASLYCQQTQQTGRTTSPGEPCVTVRVHEELHVKELSHSWVVEHQDAFKEDHVHWLNSSCLLQPAVEEGERSHGLVTTETSSLMLVEGA